MANGSAVVLHSLVFDDSLVSSDKQNELKHLINNTPAGEIVYIEVVPLTVYCCFAEAHKCTTAKKLAGSSHIEPTRDSTPDWLAIKIYRCGRFSRF